MKVRTTIAGTVCALLAGGAMAERVEGPYWDVDNCDNHGDLRAVEELGNLFPQDELIESRWTFWDPAACPASDNPQIPNVLVEMDNLTGRYWDNLFYVADWEDTLISNFDGVADDVTLPVGGWFAFRIDSVGLNRPLIFESMTPDGIFEPGETWQFIIDDYANLYGVAPSAFGSVGFAGASWVPFDPVLRSSGSIVQFVPSPGTLALLGVGGALAARRRR